MSVYKIYKISNWLYSKGIPIMPKIIQIIMRVIYSCYIPYECSIGEGTIFVHEGLGCVIHQNSTIGKKCFINTSVVIGGSNHKKTVPSIGNNVYIGTGAKILGDVKVGDNVAIGANSVVITDVPSNCLVVGSPAKIVKRNININNYL